MQCQHLVLVRCPGQPLLRRARIIFLQQHAQHELGICVAMLAGTPQPQKASITVRFGPLALYQHQAGLEFATDEPCFCRLPMPEKGLVKIRIHPLTAFIEVGEVPLGLRMSVAGRGPIQCGRADSVTGHTVALLECHTKIVIGLKMALQGSRFEPSGRLTEVSGGALAAGQQRRQFELGLRITRQSSRLTGAPGITPGFVRIGPVTIKRVVGIGQGSGYWQQHERHNPLPANGMSRHITLSSH